MQNPAGSKVAGFPVAHRRMGQSHAAALDVLINMLERFAMKLRSSPARQEMYAQFHPRLLDMRRSSDIGWGYGDMVQETVDELDTALG